MAALDVPDTSRSQALPHGLRRGAPVGLLLDVEPHNQVVNQTDCAGVEQVSEYVDLGTFDVDLRPHLIVVGHMLAQPR